MKYKKTLLLIVVVILAAVGLIMMDHQDQPLEAKNHGVSKVEKEKKEPKEIEPKKTQTEKVQQVKRNNQSSEPEPEPEPENNQPAAKPKQDKPDAEHKDKENKQQNQQSGKYDGYDEPIPDEYKGITREHIESLTKEERSTIPKEIKEVFHIAGDGTLASELEG